MKSCWDHLCVLSIRPPLPLLRFGFEFSSFGVFCVWRRQSFEFVFWWTLCDDSNPSSLVSNPLESRVLTNWSFLRSWENPNPLWSSLEFSRFFNLLGEISRGYVHGTVVKVSSKFRWIWTSFARNSSFKVLFTGFSGCHRSDRTARPVRPVKTCSDCHDRSDRLVAPVRPVQADSSAICLVLLPQSFLRCAAVR